MTKDEKFLLALYREVGDSTKKVSLEQLSSKVGFSQRQVKSILRWLLQANFVKLHEGQLELTDHGRKIAKQIEK